MIEKRKESYVFVSAPKILVFALCLAFWYANYQVQAESECFRRISLLGLTERSAVEGADACQEAGVPKIDKIGDSSAVRSKVQTSQAEAEAGNGVTTGSMPTEHLAGSVDDLISPIVSMCVIELTNIYGFLELEYNSISSVPMLDNLEECVNTRDTINGILKVMIRARELLLYAGKDNFSENTLLREGPKMESIDKKKGRNRTSDLIFYLQTNIAILKRTVSLYNIKYKVFSNQEQILGHISRLMGEINALVSRFKGLTKSNKNTFEKVMFEITKPVSRITGEYKSVLREINLFMYAKYYTSHSKNVEHYIQTISCMLKYRLQRSSIFDELQFVLDQALGSCR